MLKRLLHIEDSKFTKQDYIASLVSPYIDKTGKPRLIEPPHKDLKTIQKRFRNSYYAAVRQGRAYGRDPFPFGAL